MSLLDEWEAGGTRAYGDARPNLEPVLSDDGSDGGMASPRGVLPDVIFSLETVERHIARGRGAVTSLAAASDSIVVVTSRAWLLRYDFSQGTSPVLEVELSKAAGAKATGVWMDPEGNHMLVAVSVTGTGHETHYLHARWKKSRIISKLKNVAVTCVAWDGRGGSEATTGEVVVGSEAGTLHGFCVEERDKKERHARPLYDMVDRREAIIGAAQQGLPRGRTLVLVATASRLYVFAGAGSADAVLASYPPNVADLHNFLEAGGGGASGGQLALFTPPGQDKAERFAWLRADAIQQGRLALDLATAPDSDLDNLTECAVLDLPAPFPARQERTPAMALTEFHMVMLTGSRLSCVNRVSGVLVQEVPLGARLGAGPGSQPLGLAQDQMAGAVYLFTGDAVHEVGVRDEARDMWRTYLDQGSYVEAFRACRNQAQRDAVSVAEADAAYQGGDLLRAAGLYGRVTSAQPSFEEVALKFVEAGMPRALQAFLLARLNSLASEDKAQATMVATWLTELYLDQINRALLEEAEGDEGEGQAAVEKLVQQLRAFLRSHCDSLDPAVTVTLLASYGRLDDLMHYAQYRQDHEAVLEYLTQRGDAAAALTVLRTPGVSRELFYKFAPALMVLDAHAMVDAWMGVQPALDPRRLVPALLRCGERGSPPHLRQEALRYIDFCIRHLESSDAAVHNLAVSLYCGEEDESLLLAHLSGARDPLGAPLYDPQYALRLARQWGRKRAAIALFCELAMYEDAMKLALTVDMDTAAGVAARPEDDEVLQRKLWLLIARHLITSSADASGGNPGASIGRVNDFLRQAGGLVKIEDILPLFPDFVQIDNFKEAICQSLEDYNAQIERLKGEMADATRIADALRKDMALLDLRQATLDVSEPCARCGRPVGGPPLAAGGPAGGALPRFYLFPTGNAFHGVCLAAEVSELAPPAQATRIATLVQRLAKVSSSGPPSAGGSPAAPTAELVAALEEEIAVEDPYCGEMVILQISKTFIGPDEQELVRSWQV